ncbi:MAG: hypothetical protein IT320_17960 [Anaerolineae bacterium]|nr:hypothetical protein [Anaerolineae bacterium]
MRTLLIVVILFLLPIASLHAQADPDPRLSECGYDAVALHSAIEADGLPVDRLIQLEWSPNCRYLALRLPSSHGDPGMTVVWDAQSNTRVGSITTYAPGGRPNYQWDPRGDYLVVSANDEGTYLWHVPSNRQMPINPFECGLVATSWDYDAQQLYATSPLEWGDNWCTPYIETGGLRIYDLTTGTTIATYRVGGYSLDYEFSDDGRYMILSGHGMSNVPVQVWDRTTGSLVASVPVDEGGGINHTGAQIAISPDGRYLAIGMLYLRIWDLTQLVDDGSPQAPAFRYAGPTERIREVRFVDNQTLETSTWSGTQRWDLLTGAQLP